MKCLKKLVSFGLVICMFVTGITNVFAGGGDEEKVQIKNIISVAVVGDDDEGKLNFINGYTNRKGKEYQGIESFRLNYKEKGVSFFNIPSDLGSGNENKKEWIDKFLSNSFKLFSWTNSSISNPECSYVIICLNIENSKEDLVNRTDYWLRYIKSKDKDHQVQVVLYSVTEENISGYYDKINSVIRKVCDFEGEFMQENPGIYQFRSTSSYPYCNFKILDILISGSHLYIQKKKNSDYNDAHDTCINVSLVCGGSGLGLLIISGLLLCVTYLFDK